MVCVTLMNDCTSVLWWESSCRFYTEQGEWPFQWLTVGSSLGSIRGWEAQTATKTGISLWFLGSTPEKQWHSQICFQAWLQSLAEMKMYFHLLFWLFLLTLLKLISCKGGASLPPELGCLGCLWSRSVIEMGQQLCLPPVPKDVCVALTPCV